MQGKRSNKIQDNFKKLKKRYINDDVFEDEGKTNLKKKKVKKPFRDVGIILVVCAVLVFGFVNKERLSPENISDWFLSDVIGVGRGSGYPINIDGTVVENNNFKMIKNDIAMLSDVSFSSFNKSGREIANKRHSFATPKLKINGKYAMIYNVGGKGIQIETEKDTIYKTDFENNIISADISSNANYVVVTESNGYLSEMTLYSNKNKEKYKYYFSEYYVTDVSINSKGNYVTVCGVSSDAGNVKSAVYIFDFKSEKPSQVLEYKGNMLFSISFLNDNDIVTVGDKGISFMKTSSKESKDFSYESKHLKCFKVSSNQGATLALSETIDGRNCKVISFDNSGNKKMDLQTNYKIKDVSLKDGSVAILESDKIHKYNYKGDQKGEVLVGDDIRQVELSSSRNAFILGVGNVYKVFL